MAWAVVVIALGVRIGVLVAMPEGLNEDPDAYRALAENIIEHGTLGRGDVASAYRPPLYPVVLTPCVLLGEYTPVAIGVLHVLLGVGTVVIVYRLAQACRLGWGAVVAALLVAGDPILLGQSVQVMTETTATFLTALALWRLVRTVQQPTIARAAAFGAAGAAAGLCRPELFLWIGLCVPVLWLMLESWAARFRVVGTTVAVAAVVVAPWAVRNAVQFGRPMVTTTHGGYTLLLANNRPFYEYLRGGEPGTVWNARELGDEFGGHAAFESPEEESLTDRLAYDLAWNNMTAQPDMFAWSCVVRVGRLWALAPHQGSTARRVGVAVWYVGVFALALVGMWRMVRERDDPGGLWLWSVLLVVSITGVHAIYWSNMRMRAPLVPVVALAAAAGLLGRRAQAEGPKSKGEHDLDAWITPQ
ncbi:MAG: glycosyltransferase family 39 protein [Pirellulales bacterium]|nr:glycosyltransferase family 39 protein [Pirellulales bacterium]